MVPTSGQDAWSLMPTCGPAACLLLSPPCVAVPLLLLLVSRGCVAVVLLLVLSPFPLLVHANPNPQQRALPAATPENTALPMPTPQKPALPNPKACTCLTAWSATNLRDTHKHARTHARAPTHTPTPTHSFAHSVTRSLTHSLTHCWFLFHRKCLREGGEEGTSRALPLMGHGEPQWN